MKDKFSLMHSVLSPFMAVCMNIIVVFVVYAICRVEFLLENYKYFANTIAEGGVLHLFVAGAVFDTPGIFYTNALYILMMLLPLHYKESSAAYYAVCKWIYIIINSIAAVANLADSVYFTFTMKRTTADVAGEFANENNLMKIFGAELLTHWYLVLLFILLVWGMWRFYSSPKMDIRRQRLPRYYLLSADALVIAAITVISGIRGGFLNHWYNYLIALPLAYVSYRFLKVNRKSVPGIMFGIAAICLLITAPIGGWRHRDIRPIALSNALAYTNHPAETALVLNTPFSIIRSVGNSPYADPHYFNSAAEKNEMRKLFNPVVTPASVAADGTRKNIVVIIIESFGREYIGGFSRQVLGESYEGYTPFADSLMNRSVTFRHSFANGRKSIDGMPSILSSIPMFVKPFILTPQSMNEVQGIPQLLKEKGYTSAFFHGARTGSMGFDGFAHSIGFDSYYGKENFEREYTGDKEGTFDGYWAIWDEPFLQYYAEKMSEMKQPFMTSVFTASSHHPFHIPQEYAGKFKEEALPIHKCIRYTDNALRRFFETASRQPWYENTVFFITSDHTNQSNHDEFRSDIGVFSAPLIIFDPSGSIPPGMREGVAQQTDILPTVMGLTGYDKPYLAYGVDLLDSKEEDLWAVNYQGGIYQYVKYGYVLQFDGVKPTGLYRLGDYLMKEDLLGKEHNAAVRMELELKAIIQTYMDSMLEGKLRL